MRIIRNSKQGKKALQENHLLCVVYLCLQRMRKIKPFKLFDVTRILNPAERQRMMTCAVNRILAAESELGTDHWK